MGNIKNIIKVLICVLVFVFCSFVFVSFLLSVGPMNEEQPPLKPSSSLLPASSFSPSIESYHQLNAAPLQLNYLPPALQAPDLSRQLIFRGSNKRPDSQGKGKLFFSFASKPEKIERVEKSTPVYLNKIEERLDFSPGNRPTDLWFVADPSGTEVKVSVYLKGEEGVRTKSFNLKESPLPMGTGWQIDQARVDSSFWVRQGVKWWGRDLFLEEFGGKEYEAFQGKEKLVFKDKEEEYSLYISPGEQLVFEKGRWRVEAPSSATQGLPLFVLEKVEERLLTGTLYQPAGEQKITLNLLKAVDPLSWEPMRFQFMGARTRMHSLFKVEGKREIVGPEDWLLLEKGKWQKIKTVQEIDAYLEGKLGGPLLIVGPHIEKEGKPYYEATLFNKSRSASKKVEIPLFQREGDILQEKAQSVNPSE